MAMLDSKLACALQPNISFLSRFLKMSQTFGTWDNLGRVKHYLHEVHLKKPCSWFCQWFPLTWQTFCRLSWASFKFGSHLFKVKTWHGRPGARCCNPACEVVQYLATVCRQYTCRTVWGVSLMHYTGKQHWFAGFPFPGRESALYQNFSTAGSWA